MYQLAYFNDASGTVVDIVYKDGYRPSDRFPEAVMVHFPGYTGPLFIEENPKVVPVEPSSCKIAIEHKFLSGWVGQLKFTVVRV